MNSSTKYITIIIVLVLALAGIQWYLNVRENDGARDDFGDNALPTATTTPTALPTSTNSPSTKPATTTNNQTKNFMHKATIETDKGTIVFETYDADAPKAVNNFIALAEKGFYSGVIFHRVISGFMIQGGDPTGTGRGGPGYQFEDELDSNTPSYKAGYVRGTVAMANAGPNTNGSQFFIMHRDTPLPHNYTIFGRVISGMEVVDAIAGVQVGPEDRPITPIAIKKVTIEDR